MYAMSGDDVGSGLGVQLTGLAAKHPRLVVSLVLLLALIVAQGSVAAATDLDASGMFVDTAGSGSVDDGP